MAQRNAAQFKLEYKDRCMKILEELFSHPISEVFRDPVDPIRDEVPDYLEVIQIPSDLTTVRNRLRNDRYRSLQDFKRDVNLIWENAVQYNGRPSLPAYIADELSRIFRRRFSALEEPPTDQWINDYLKSRSVICKLFRNAPKGLSSFGFPKESGYHDVEGSSKKHRVSDEDLEFFEKSASLFKDPVLFGKFVKLIQENEPSIDTSASDFCLDLCKISPRSLRVLKSWIIDVKRELEKKAK
jgi:hypothetical protein